jgi:glycosyltransferase involved in cell wall biosynthesis
VVGKQEIAGDPNRPVIICFAGTTWDGNPHSRHHLMRRFAEAYEVLFVEGIPMRSVVVGDKHEIRRLTRKLSGRFGLRTVAPGLHVLRAYPIPPTGRLGRRLQLAAVRAQVLTALRRIRACGPRIAWFSLPTVAPLRGRLGECGSVFYYQDRYDAFSNVDTSLIRRHVASLAGSCDITFTSADTLAAELRDLGAEPSVVPHGVDLDRFDRRQDVPDDLQALERPLVGYVGVIDDFVSFPHLIATANYLHRGTVVLVGPANVPLDALRHPRIRVLGPRPYERVPGYMQAFDCCTIPFVVNRLTEAINPIKLREYLAAGRPVVATPLPEIRAYSDVVVFEQDVGRFARAVAQTLERDPDAPRSAAKRRKRVEPESWDAVAGLIEPSLRGLAERS